MDIYHKTLGVKKCASVEEIESAVKYGIKLCRETGNIGEIDRVLEAYSKLVPKNRRKSITELDIIKPKENKVMSTPMNKKETINNYNTNYNVNISINYPRNMPLSWDDIKILCQLYLRQNIHNINFDDDKEKRDITNLGFCFKIDSDVIPVKFVFDEYFTANDFFAKHIITEDIVARYKANYKILPYIDSGINIINEKSDVKHIYYLYEIIPDEIFKNDNRKISNNTIINIVSLLKQLTIQLKLNGNLPNKGTNDIFNENFVKIK